MNTFALSLLFIVSPFLARAINVDSKVKRFSLRRAEPKVGMAVELTTDVAKYEAECEASALMAIFDGGTKGTIKDIDKSGTGSVLLKSEAGDEAWVPLRALVSFGEWVKGGAAPGNQPAPGGPPAQGGPGDVWKPAPPVDHSASDFMSNGCLRSEEVKHGYTRSSGMSASKCFIHCKKKTGVRYFGLMKGGVCFCSKLPIGEKVNDKLCDMPCSGNKKEKCGSITAATVYTMMNCNELSAHGVARERALKLAGLYDTYEKQSCGQAKNNHCELNGSSKMLGTPDECKLACWDAKGSDRCDGFTYNKVLGRCRFYKDVTNGQTKKEEGLTCYFKKMGFPV